MSDLVDMTPAELEYALLLAKEQVSADGHTFPMQALRADKFARGLIEQHARDLSTADAPTTRGVTCSSTRTSST